MIETTEGIITRIISHKRSRFSAAGLPYLIAKLNTGETVMGEMAKPPRGDVSDERIRFYGHRRPDRRKPSELVFAFDHHEILIDPSESGMAEYLYRHVDGIGRARARALVDTFGAETIHILRTEPERAIEVKGIDAVQVNRIREHFEEELTIDPAAYARLVTLLGEHKVPKKLVTQLLKDWGSNAPAKITENPYLLLDYPRTSWDMVDAFALQTVRYAPDGIERQMAAISEALARTTDDGHTIAPRIDVESVAFSLIGFRPPLSSWVAAQKEERFRVSDDGADAGELGTFLAPPKLDEAERYIASRLSFLRRMAKPLPITVDDIEKLTGDQREAARLILDERVAVLAGAPGTGKTFVVSRLLSALVRVGFDSIRIMTPTGKAAKRAEELVCKAIGERASAIPCTTIHKALGIGIGDDEEGVPKEAARIGRGRNQFGFQHDESDPLQNRVFILDEASMVDVGLFARALRAIPLGATVLIVGDPNQLPSIGPGAVLRDLIASGFPTATLTEILRSDGGGRVVRACHAIKDGRVPEPAPRLVLPTDNWYHEEVADPASIAAKIVELVGKVKAGTRLGLDPIWDVQVISPEINKPHFGCNALNDQLSDLLNATDSAPCDDTDELRFRRGDKVIRRKNGKVDEMVPADGAERPDWTWEHPETGEGGDWSFQETAVVNGDMGIVEDLVINDRGAWVVVQFRNPDRLCRLRLGSCKLQRAYAITAHSSQGSGYQYVILPVHSSFYFDDRNGKGLWCRELIYTAISRSELILMTVGEMSAIHQAIGRKTLHRRRTRLVERLQYAASHPRATQEEGKAKAIEATPPAEGNEDDFTLPAWAAGDPEHGGFQPDPYDFPIPF